jgi:hypothetical protein
MSHMEKGATDWKLELELAEKQFEKWESRGKKIVRRYRDERDPLVEKSRRYNVLWSNVRTLKAAIYARKPKADVSRRYNDADPVARAASTILERCLNYEIEQYEDYDSAIRNALDDRLLPGRGVAWIRYEPYTREIPEESESEEGEPQITDDVESYEEIYHETTPVDYVYWQDFICDPARTWEEVRWVGRRVYMGREEGIERFGDEFKTVPLTDAPSNISEQQLKSQAGGKMKKAEVWEIWNKDDKKVYWLCKSHMGLLDVRDDPLELECFFPCPKPLFATLTTDSLIPVPDYALYQDQAEELDELTERISLLVKAVKVVGVYDSSQAGVQRMLNEGTDNVLIPVDTWAAFAEKGGVKGVVDFLPLDNVIKALAQLYEARESSKQLMYEITGMSDIIRGASIASETATAQQIKSQYASLRLKESTQDVARFATELLRIKAQIICSKYQDETIMRMSGIEQTGDGQLAMQAIQVLRDDVTRNFRIDIEADSMVITDEQQEKQDRVEFLTAAGGFLEKAVIAGTQEPRMAPLLAEMLMFGVRGFKAGKTLESAFEQTMQALQQPKPPESDPESAKAQAQAQSDQMKAQMQAQADQAKMQMDMQLETMRQQNAQQIEAMRLQNQQMIAQQNAQLQLLLARIKEQTAVEVAEIGAQTTLDSAQITAANTAGQED